MPLPLVAALLFSDARLIFTFLRVIDGISMLKLFIVDSFANHRSLYENQGDEHFVDATVFHPMLNDDVDY